MLQKWNLIFVLGLLMGLCTPINAISGVSTGYDNSRSGACSEARAGVPLMSDSQDKCSCYQERHSSGIGKMWVCEVSYQPTKRFDDLKKKQQKEWDDLSERIQKDLDSSMGR